MFLSTIFIIYFIKFCIPIININKISAGYSVRTVQLFYTSYENEDRLILVSFHNTSLFQGFKGIIVTKTVHISGSILLRNRFN